MKNKKVNIIKSGNVSKIVGNNLFFTLCLIFFIILSISLVFSSSLAYAHSDHPEHGDSEKAEAIINAQIPCSELNEEDLEMVGDYIMEQMHPGEQHEVMDERMGGEGSETLRLAHINMAEVHYCEYKSIDSGYSMMGGGMMNMMFGNYAGLGFGWMFLMWFFWIAIIIAIIALIVWLVLTLTKQNHKESKTRKRRKKIR